MGWAEIVRDFYYDLICRVPSGLLLIFGGVVAVLHVKEIDKYNIFLTTLSSMSAGTILVLLLVFSLMAYALGLMLSGLSGLLGALVRRIVWKHQLEPLYGEAISKRLQEELDALRKNNYSREAFYMLDRLLEESVKRFDNQAKMTVVRMRAEAALAANIVSTCIVLLVWIGLLHIFVAEGQGIPITGILGLSLLLILSIWAMFYRTMAFWQTKLVLFFKG